MNAIASQQQLLSQALEAGGWRITDRLNNLADSWFYEIWTIESLWRPVGLLAFISFLIDPHPPSPTKKRRRLVGGVECTDRSPLEQGTSPEKIASIGITHWDEGVPDLIRNLARFRDASA